MQFKNNLVTLHFDGIFWTVYESILNTHLLKYKPYSRSSIGTSIY